MTHRIFKNKIFEIVNDVAVYESNVPRAFTLLRHGKEFVAIPINELENVTFPTDGKINLGIGDEQKIEIVYSVLEHHFGPRQSWSTKSRKREQVIPRQIFMWALKTCTNLTLSAIGKLLADGKDHATVLHSAKAIESCIAVGDRHVLRVVDDLSTIFTKYGYFEISNRASSLMVEYELMKSRVKSRREGEQNN